MLTCQYDASYDTRKGDGCGDKYNWISIGKLRMTFVIYGAS
jgi:hypothetical protein